MPRLPFYDIPELSKGALHHTSTGTARPGDEARDQGKGFFQEEAVKSSCPWRRAISMNAWKGAGCRALQKSIWGASMQPKHNKQGDMQFHDMVLIHSPFRAPIGTQQALAA